MSVPWGISDMSNFLMRTAEHWWILLLSVLVLKVIRALVSAWGTLWLYDVWCMVTRDKKEARCSRWRPTQNDQCHKKGILGILVYLNDFFTSMLKNSFFYYYLITISRAELWVSFISVKKNVKMKKKILMCGAETKKNFPILSSLLLVHTIIPYCYFYWEYLLAIVGHVFNQFSNQFLGGIICTIYSIIND